MVCVRVLCSCCVWFQVFVCFVCGLVCDAVWYVALCVWSCVCFVCLCRYACELLCDVVWFDAFVMCLECVCCKCVRVFCERFLV